MDLYISPKVEQKLLEQHDVTVDEVHQCFYNREMKLQKDLRPEHYTEPLTRWFIARTNAGRMLQICYIPYSDRPALKTAFTLDD